MKISKKYLQKIIKEEIELLILESDDVRAAQFDQSQYARQTQNVKLANSLARAMQNIYNGRDMEFLLKTVRKLQGADAGDAREFAMGIEGVDRQLRNLVMLVDDLDLS